LFESRTRELPFPKVAAKALPNEAKRLRHVIDFSHFRQ
jgi:hypothetical protein